jgi:hypothetical protein
MFRETAGLRGRFAGKAEVIQVPCPWDFAHNILKGPELLLSCGLPINAIEHSSRNYMYRHLHYIYF